MLKHSISLCSVSCLCYEHTVLMLWLDFGTKNPYVRKRSWFKTPVLVATKFFSKISSCFMLTNVDAQSQTLRHPLKPTDLKVRLKTMAENKVNINFPMNLQLDIIKVLGKYQPNPRIQEKHRIHIGRFLQKKKTKNYVETKHFFILCLLSMW